MINNETAKSTYTIIADKYDYPIGFQYAKNPNATPQIKLYLNKLSETPLIYGVDYTLSEDGLSVVLESITAGDRLDIIRDIPMVQLSDYVIGRIDPEQIEADLDEAVMRDQQLHAEAQFALEIPEDHEIRIQKNTQDIDTIESYIPTQASDSNQLADKNFVNSSIGTSTAVFRGTYNSLAELEAVTADENDYGFVVSEDAAGNTVYSRYKYTTATTPASWVFEYALNNSSFTAAQWAAINSNITSELVTKLTNMPAFILSVSVNEITGAVSVVASTSITSIALKKLFGGATITGTASISGATATFTPTTITDITVEDWVIEVR